MSDTLARTDPIPTKAFVTPGATISLALPMARYSLRARDPRWIDSLLRTKLPRPMGTFSGGAARLGPDEWLLRAPPGTAIPDGSGKPMSIVDISERSVCLIVEGPKADALLMSGCPLDLHGFAVGRATRTIYETVEIILLRESEACYQVEVWRSFAPWLWGALTLAATHLE